MKLHLETSDLHICQDALNRAKYNLIVARHIDPPRPAHLYADRDQLENELKQVQPLYLQPIESTQSYIHHSYMVATHHFCRGKECQLTQRIIANSPFLFLAWFSFQSKINNLTQV